MKKLLTAALVLSALITTAAYCANDNAWLAPVTHNYPRHAPAPERYTLFLDEDEVCEYQEMNRRIQYENNCPDCFEEW